MKQTKIALIAAGLFLSAVSGTALAQTGAEIPAEAPAAPVKSTAQQPIEISADDALEWDRTNSRYHARGHAIAKQDTFQVEADILTADYREGAQGGTEIYRLTAEGHVVLSNDGAKAYGDRAVYDVDTARAVMTGTDLRARNAEMTLTAKDSFEYFSNEGRIVASGSPVITNADSRLTADHIVAWTAQEKDKASTGGASPLGGLDRAEATGHVVITTPKENATANRAVYSGKSDTVELSGDVVLYQGENKLQGARAEMNLTTKLSRMFAATEKGGRVKGVFFPSSAKTAKP